MSLVAYVTQPCIVCGERSEIELHDQDINRWKSGEYVQDVWPDMPVDGREILISGTHPACFDQLIGEE